MKNLFNNMDSSEIVRILEMHKKQGYSTINEQKQPTKNKGLSDKFKNAQNIALNKGQLAFKFNGKIHSTKTGLVLRNPFKTPEELENFQKYVIKIIRDPSIGRADSLWGVKSATAAIKYGLKYRDYLNKQKSKPKSKDRCIAISTQECAKIDSTKQTLIGGGTETQCSAYMIKCLSQYDKELGGNAWSVFPNIMQRNIGTVKYNVYTDGSVNWDYIRSEVKKNKIGKTACDKFKSVHSDKGELPKIISKSMPKSSKVDINSLKLGDIVGLYHSKSTSKCVAFCDRAVKDRGLKDDFELIGDPFTFNSHVGFVGAIKDGMPIIIHNVGGSNRGNHIATPADRMLSVTSEDMIVWVVSDNKVTAALEKENNNTVV
jgi:hypothetical protein